jgi:hypothetical protein
MDIAKTLSDAVAAGDVPGVAAAAATDKGVIFEGGAGVLRPDSVIWIASMTKAVTAAAARACSRASTRAARRSCASPSSRSHCGTC